MNRNPAKLRNYMKITWQNFEKNRITQISVLSSALIYVTFVASAKVTADER